MGTTFLRAERARFSTLFIRPTGVRCDDVPDKKQTFSFSFLMLKQKLCTRMVGEEGGQFDIRRIDWRDCNVYVFGRERDAAERTKMVDLKRAGRDLRNFNNSTQCYREKYARMERAVYLRSSSNKNEFEGRL